MRGANNRKGVTFRSLSRDHPFAPSKVYADEAPVKAQRLIALYSVRSDRLFCEMCVDLQIHQASGGAERQAAWRRGIMRPIAGRAAYNLLRMSRLRPHRCLA